MISLSIFTLKTKTTGTLNKKVKKEEKNISDVNELKTENMFCKQKQNQIRDHRKNKGGNQKKEIFIKIFI